MRNNIFKLPTQTNYKQFFVYYEGMYDVPSYCFITDITNSSNSSHIMRKLFNILKK